MAIAYKCDRCGTFFIPDNDMTIKRINLKRCKFNSTSLLAAEVIIKSIGLCDSCADEFVAWLNDGKVNKMNEEKITFDNKGDEKNEKMD